MKKSLHNSKYANKIIEIVAICLIGIVTGVGVDIVIRPTVDDNITVEAGFSMELSDIQIPAIITEYDHDVIIGNIVTVESVDGNQYDNECNDECGLGEFIYAPTESPTAFKDYTLGKCWDLDYHWSAQCWDLGQLFWTNYAGRNLSTCDTGIARGIWNCKEQNAGDDFELIYYPEQLKAGDWVIFSGGQYGHIGMALGSYNNGYITLLGQNQGGASCDGNGGATNIINMSLKTFLGAFRPKSYINPELIPEPEPIPVSGCVLWHVKRGDTMSRIMLDCEGTVVYGEAMDNYAKSWYSLIYNPNQSVYDGWNSPSGVGLYAGDDIEHRIR